MSRNLLDKFPIGVNIVMQQGRHFVRLSNLESSISDLQSRMRRLTKLLVVSVFGLPASRKLRRAVAYLFLLVL
jgi:hypothetical protein